MKNVFLVLLIIVGLHNYAQTEKVKHGKSAEMTQISPEQKNLLQLKKLTLKLDLNETQQKEFGKILANQTLKIDALKAERKALKEKGIKPSADERFEKQKNRLDDAIAMNSRVKKILSQEQYIKWGKIQHESEQNRQHHKKKDARKNLKSEE